MKFITSEHLKNVINENAGEEVIVSKYELVMLIAKRAKQIAEQIADEEPNTESMTIVKPISVAIDEIERNELCVEKREED